MVSAGRQGAPFVIGHAPDAKTGEAPGWSAGLGAVCRPFALFWEGR